MSKEVVDVNLDTVFAQLVSNNIFSLPDNDDLKLGKYEYDPITREIRVMGIGIGDGVSYIIEFKVGDMYSRYGYYCPAEYADFYPESCELRNFVNIVTLFNECTK